jgi:hypothetical protein
VKARDVEMFTAWALSGLCAHHNVFVSEGEPHHLPVEKIAARAVEIGKATADELERQLTADEPKG